MNKKGFTLVELLATIVLITIISGMAVVAYTSILNGSRDRVFEAYQKTMKSEVMHYLQLNIDNLPPIGVPTNYYISEVGGTPNFPIDPINNPVNTSDLCLGSYVKVTRTLVNGVDSFIYESCLICSDSNYNHCESYEN